MNSSNFLDLKVVGRGKCENEQQTDDEECPAAVELVGSDIWGMLGLALHVYRDDIVDSERDKRNVGGQPREEIGVEIS